VGTPVDPTPDVVRQALCDSTDAPGYPQTWGTQELREAVADWFARRRGVPDVDPDAVLPTIGSKELIAWLPTLLGLGAGDTVVHPQIAYPTYDVGARLAGARALAADGTAQIGPARVSLYWLNSPSNPTGRVLGVDHLRKVVAWARQRGVVVASDECYAELGWEDEWSDGAPSLLDPRVCGGSHEGLLVVYSLSKQSSMAGYRAGFVAGDPELVSRLLQVRKHAGMIVPLPIQHAMTAALRDDEHVAVQKDRYAQRRHVLMAAVEAAGMRVDHSVAGLYLWVTADEPAARTVERLAELGILVAPGTFYGPGGASHVRMALTATDERVAAAASRLTQAPVRR
jgi:succinyldiaminopimelate transaminase